MVLVVDMKSQYCLSGTGGAAKPSTEALLFIGDPGNPLPIDPLIKIDEIESLPVFEGCEESGALRWDPVNVVNFFVNHLADLDGDKRALVSMPQVLETDLKNTLAEIFIERHDFVALMPQTSEVLSLFGSARTTGVVVDYACLYASVSIVVEGVIKNHNHDVTIGSHAFISPLFYQMPVAYGLSPSSDDPFVKDSFRRTSKMATLHRSIKTGRLPDGVHLGPGSAEELHRGLRKLSAETTESAGAQGVYNNVVVTDELSQSLMLLTGGEEALVEALSIHNLQPLAEQPEKGWRLILRPSETAWFGGSLLSCLPVYEELAITKIEWSDCGETAWLRRGYQ